MKAVIWSAVALTAQQAEAQIARPKSLICILEPLVDMAEAARIRFRTDRAGRLIGCEVTIASNDAGVNASACAKMRSDLAAAPVRHRNLDRQASCFLSSGSDPPPAPPAPPPPARAVGSAPRLLSPDRLLGEDDYPILARRALAEGTVRARLSVDAEGRVDACEVLASAGHAALDQATCRALRRARFVPARDAAGAAVAGTLAQNVRWRLPAFEVGAPRIVLERGADQRVSRCELRAGADTVLPFALEECRRLDELAGAGPLASGVPFELAAPDDWSLPPGLKRTGERLVTVE